MSLKTAIHKFSWQALFVCFLVILNSPAFADTLYGQVISVTDGDTITILTPAKSQIKVRLTEIDAPEKNQPYGQRSKQALSSIVFNKQVDIQSQGKDRYSRVLGRVFIEGQDVNLYMAQNGHAWAYTKYLTDPNIKKAEQSAQKRLIGLWALQRDQIVPPWEWRRLNR